MKKIREIKCSMTRLAEIVNGVGGDVIYLNTKTSWVESSDACGFVEKDDFIITPYMDSLYSQNQALGDYISEMDIHIPMHMSARAYLRQTGQIYDFYEYYKNELDKLMSEWCENNQIKIQFVA